ncbi:MAG: hypothetical protein ACKO7B_06870, partial [Flavobacteriales bacterium]
MTRIVASVFVVLLLSFTTRAQYCVVVLDEATREPLPFATLLIDENSVLSTDSTGGVCSAALAGKHRLKCSMIGFQDFDKTVELA